MGRFYKSAQPKNIDFFYKQPTSLMIAVGEKVEGDIDTTLEGLEKMKSLYAQQKETPSAVSSGMAMPQDLKDREKIVREYETRIDEMSRGIMKDPLSYRRMGADISDIRNEIKDNLLYGQLAAYNENFSKVDKWTKDQKTAGVSPEKINKVLEMNLGKWKGTQWEEGNYRDVGEYLSPTVYGEDIPVASNELVKTIMNHNLTKPEMYKRAENEILRHEGLIGAMGQELDLAAWNSEDGPIDLKAEDKARLIEEGLKAQARKSVDYLYKQYQAPKPQGGNGNSKMIVQGADTAYTYFTPVVPQESVLTVDVPQADGTVKQQKVVVDHKQEIENALNNNLPEEEKLKAVTNFVSGLQQSLSQYTTKASTLANDVSLITNHYDDIDFVPFGNINKENLIPTINDIISKTSNPEALAKLGGIKMSAIMNDIDNKISVRTLQEIYSTDDTNEKLRYAKEAVSNKKVPVSETWIGFDEDRKKEVETFYGDINNIADMPLVTTDGQFDINGRPASYNELLVDAKSQIEQYNKAYQDFYEKRKAAKPSERENMVPPTPPKSVLIGEAEYTDDATGMPLYEVDDSFTVSKNSVGPYATPDAYGRLKLKFVAGTEKGEKVQAFVPAENVGFPAGMYKDVYAQQILSKINVSDLLTPYDDALNSKSGGKQRAFNVYKDLWIKVVGGQKKYYQEVNGKQIELSEYKAMKHLSELLKN